MEESTGDKLKGLRTFNAAMGVMHLVQGMLMLAISNSFTLPITRTYLSYNEVTERLDTATETIYNIKLGPLVALFLLMSAIAHLLVSTVLYSWYVRNLGRHINVARWVEYAFSSSVMIVIIAMLTGVYDVYTLISIFALNAMMILFGWMMELHNQTTQKTDFTAFVFGCIAGIVPWIVIGASLLRAGIESEGEMPTFVYYIFLSIAIFFNVFAINQYLQYKRYGRWIDYLYGERMYVILSLVAKSALAWQVFAGTLRP